MFKLNATPTALMTWYREGIFLSKRQRTLIVFIVVAAETAAIPVNRFDKRVADVERRTDNQGRRITEVERKTEGLNVQGLQRRSLFEQYLALDGELAYARVHRGSQETEDGDGHHQFDEREPFVSPTTPGNIRPTGTTPVPSC